MDLPQKELEVRSNTTIDLKIDASFRKLPKNASCFVVWKIDEDRLEAETKANYGTFYDNCAYIIYAAAPHGQFANQDTITREQKITLERFLHFWLGSGINEQNRSNVARKIQELDSYLGNTSAIYRESQNYESARFLSYFKKGVSVRCGALINSSEPNRLFQLFGRKWLRATEMPTIAWEHFNADYVMVLKTAAHIYVWIGRSSSSVERRSAIEWAAKYQSSTVDMVMVDDGYEQSMSEDLKNLWNSLLPLNNRTVCQIAQLSELQTSNKLKIYKCTYRAGRLHLDQLDAVIPTKEDLNDSTLVFVLDGYSQGIWLWVGSQATHDENVQAMGNGRAFVKKKKYLNSTPVIRVVEGYEPIEFKRMFPNWSNEGTDLSNGLKPISTKFGKLDSITLCQRPKMAADTQLIDDGRGERIMYRITKGQVIEMTPKKMVMFTTNNCYVIKYSVVCPTPNAADAENIGIKTIVYQWNGSEAKADAISKAESFAQNCFENLREKAMFVQLCEYDETSHFLQIFNGKLIILQGNKNSAINNNNNNNNINNVDCTKLSEENFLLKIYGDASYNSKAVEVYPLSSMSSKECYVIKTDHIWVWCGQSSTGDAREIAKTIGALLGESSLVLEGKENTEFWQSVANYLNQPLNIHGNNSSSNSSTSSRNSCNGNSNSNGNTSPYNNCGYVLSPPPKARPMAQLFLVWSQRGKYCNQEIMGFEQSDLCSDCVYVLDAGTMSYVWVGEHVSVVEKEKYLAIGQYYLETVPIARRPAAALAIVLQHDEPNVFKGFFDQWNPDLWKNFVSYDQKRQLFVPQTINIHATNGDNGNSTAAQTLLNHQKEFDRHHKYPISMLQQDIDSLPPEINPLRRELHLTHDDFVSLFNMSFWEFDELPGWKKQELKKKFKLF